MQAIPLTLTTEIKLAGPVGQVRIARECLEYIGLDGKMLQSLHKIVFEHSQEFQIDSGNGTTEKSVSYGRNRGAQAVLYRCPWRILPAGTADRRERNYPYPSVPADSIQQATRHEPTGQVNQGNMKTANDMTFERSPPSLSL